MDYQVTIFKTKEDLFPQMENGKIETSYSPLNWNDFSTYESGESVSQNEPLNTQYPLIKFISKLRRR